MYQEGNVWSNAKHTWWAMSMPAKYANTSPAKQNHVSFVGQVGNRLYFQFTIMKMDKSHWWAESSKVKIQKHAKLHISNHGWTQTKHFQKATINKCICKWIHSDTLSKYISYYRQFPKKSDTEEWTQVVVWRVELILIHRNHANCMHRHTLSSFKRALQNLVWRCTLFWR